MLHCLPIRPLLCPNLSADAEAGIVGSEAVSDEDVVVDISKVAVLGDLIVGTEAVTFDERGQGARQPRALPSPREPTPAERAIHYLTHLPFASWCPICVAARRPNNHHRLLRDFSRTIPLLVGDYGFIRNSGDDQLMCVLILKLYPFGVLFACMVPKKGVEASIVKKVAKFVIDMGLTHFAYRSDREPSILALFDAVCQESGRSGK